VLGLAALMSVKMATPPRRGAREPVDNAVRLRLPYDRLRTRTRLKHETEWTVNNHSVGVRRPTSPSRGRKHVAMPTRLTDRNRRAVEDSGFDPRSRESCGFMYSNVRTASRGDFIVLAERTRASSVHSRRLGGLSLVPPLTRSTASSCASKPITPSARTRGFHTQSRR
jgi:hypothetical protein